MKNLLATYGIFGVIQLIYFRIRTKLLFKNARLIRFPFKIRNKRHIKIGDNFTTGFSCRIEAFPLNESYRNCIVIGDNVQINDFVHIGAVGSIKIGNNVLMASKIYISDHNHGSYDEVGDNPLSIPIDRLLTCKPVEICDNVWLGESVCVLPGVTIGKGAVVGAMSVVTKNIPAYTIAVGNPARIVKQYNFENKKWEKK